MGDEGPKALGTAADQDAPLSMRPTTVGKNRRKFVYIDRQTLSVLAPQVKHDFAWSNVRCVRTRAAWGLIGQFGEC